MKNQPFYKLKVVGGLHKDAELFIEPEVVYRIGSGDECDIVLLDTGVESLHFTFRISQGKVSLESTTAAIFVDGRQISGPQTDLSSFQVVSIGEAHLAFGPAGEAWPAIALPKIESDDTTSVCLDLVPVQPGRNLPGTIRPAGSFQKPWRTLFEYLRLADKKILLAAGVFMLMLALFIYDTWQVCTSPAGVPEGRPDAAKSESAVRKSLLLSAVDDVMAIGRRTLVDAGLTEPLLSIQARTGKFTDDPVNNIRQALKNAWGPNLMESRTDDRTIQFKGYDDQNRQDLLLNLESNEQGQIDAEGVTLTMKKKKAILSQLGDIIRVKVDVAEDMESACQRMLEKKGIRKAKAQFDIRENSFNLQGQSDDRHTLTAIHDLIAKAFPEIKINNNVTLKHLETGKLNIRGVCTSGAAHVVLKDGSKVFTGGKLDNGCTIVGITPNHLNLDCNGSRKRENFKY